ncbi:hypothetical protein H9L13_00150 [Sphingomonas lutea]|uniref:Uncharacterized protein n=1 Tax=Sphingomonas lutea TaxID=1045317 RepID=A0A7G9SHV3_9SPHN|nr:hypothetical protein [Sphingomonas lutea]QNN67428.1 hypothetical protein H9L13_00150 [Sphingomonas lutea]
MDLIQALRERLERLPKVIEAQVPGGIRLAAPDPDGFAIEILDGPDEWTVFLGDGAFHDHFDTADEALSFVVWCYSGKARLREFSRGNIPSGAVLESLEDNTWSAVSEMKLIFVPFWRARTESVFRNPSLLKAR